MSKDVWLGGIYLKDEGGYELIFRALDHYKKRLASIGQSPELSDSPMFVQVVSQEAAKTRPKIDSIKALIQDGLSNNEILPKIQQDIPLLEKALNCYRSDIQKALNNEHPYYSKLVDNLETAKKDLEILPTAIKKIKTT